MSQRFVIGLWLIGICTWTSGCSPTQDTQPDDTVGVESGIEPAVPVENADTESIPRETVEPAIEYFGNDSANGMAQAVAVQGHPLVHTRQLLPLDAEGNLIGQGAVEKQIDQVIANLEAVLATADSGLDRLVRLHVCAQSPEVAQAFVAAVALRVEAPQRPAVSLVQSPLVHEQAMIAVDAVAVSDRQGEDVSLMQCEATSTHEQCADVSVMPRGGVVYLSGQPDKSPLAEATTKSLTTLLEVVDQLQLKRSQIAQMKVFIQPATAAEDVLGEVKKVFNGQLVPPVVFVEWIASAPIEIEMVLHLPLSEDQPAEMLRFYTPPGVKPSPTFSKVAIADTEQQIFVSGLTSREAGDGTAQVRDVFGQLEQILSDSGSDFLHLAKATYYVSDDDASKQLNELRPEYYDPQRPPAASKATVHGVAQVDRTLSIDMIAVRSNP
jgi:enamine deaminase RidA (YjgF/YER057c/UK114 family)